MLNVLPRLWKCPVIAMNFTSCGTSHVVENDRDECGGMRMFVLFANIVPMCCGAGDPGGSAARLIFTWPMLSGVCCVVAFT